jgi:integrase/recombinase XerD
MDQPPCVSQFTDLGHDDAPFGDERKRYLRHCAEHGAAPAVLKIKHNELLWIARRLSPDARQGVGMDVLRRIASQRQSLHGAVTAARRVVDIGRPWLRFLGWWRQPNAAFRYQDQLDRYVTWMRDERGFTPSTVEQLGRQAGRFLRWCEQSNRQLGVLQATDIDDYFATQATGRWSRVSVANVASALRGFLRYAATRECRPSDERRMAWSICNENVILTNQKVQVHVIKYEY